MNAFTAGPTLTWSSKKQRRPNLAPSKSGIVLGERPDMAIAAAKGALIESQRDVFEPMDAQNGEKIDQWRAAERAYYQHHAHCSQCKGAGLRSDASRCEEGQGLWDAYNGAPLPKFLQPKKLNYVPPPPPRRDWR